MDSLSRDAVIVLTPAEQRLAQYLATERTRACRTAGVVNDQVSAAPHTDIELAGAGAELAWCRLANVYPDLTLHVRAGGADARYAGRTVDVKTTVYSDGMLLATPAKMTRDGAEIYALLTGTFPRYVFRGLATAGQLLHADRLTDLGRGPTYALDQGELHA